MRSNIKYSGLGTYTKRSKNIKLGKISIAFIVTIFMLYIMFLNLRNKLVEDMAGFQEVAIVENNNINEEIKDEVKSNEGKKAVEEKDYEAVTQEVYSNTYMNSDNLEFIKSILDGAKSSYNKYGILPSITMAQAILESGWGSSELAVAHNNLFGIKADSRWDGAVATITTSENYNDSTVAQFRKYENINESIEDHGLFLYKNSRYSDCGLFDGKDYKAQAQSLEDAGYSTVKNENGEPIYAEKLIALIEKYELMKYD